MSKPLHPLALFRLMILGPLTSRGQLKRGELKNMIRHLAAQTYEIPNSQHTRLSEETIRRWYYEWKRGSIDALAPQKRCDKGNTKLPQAIQTALLQRKKDNPSRSINTLIKMLEMEGIVSKDELARATVHRFLQQQQLSKRVIPDRHTIERRAFVAEHAGDIFHGDVLHGPSIQTPRGMRKTYLVSLLDDASRLMAHSAFCLGETALDIEGVLKQAVLRRGIPYKLIIDNGAAYRSHSLQSICARLEIRLIYCRPYEPEGKGKLERFHRTFREQFLNEIELDQLSGLDDLNERLWAWLEQVYHQRAHAGLDLKTPLERWREDLIHVRPLGFKAGQIDEIFNHRVQRTVRKDGTVNWEGARFEVPYEQVGEKVMLVIEPHAKKALRIESLAGDNLGPVAPLDTHANLNRPRQRPHHSPEPARKQAKNSVELATEEQRKKYGVQTSFSFTQEEK